MLDASAGLSALFNAGPARQELSVERLHAPHLVDSEVTNGLRRRVVANQLEAGAAGQLLRTWQQLGLARYPVVGLLGRVWELRDNLSAYDACYVALAESLGCSLLTADARLAAAPALRCSVRVVPG